MTNGVIEIGLNTIIPAARWHAQEQVAEISYKIGNFQVETSWVALQTLIQI